MGTPAFISKRAWVASLPVLLTSTPDSMRKHLNPLTPSSSNAPRSCSLPGMIPPQNPTSQLTPTFLASSLLTFKFSTVVVGGIELSGMSISVVTPPLIAAVVPVWKPSQAVRPGWFKWTCVLHLLSAFRVSAFG